MKERTPQDQMWIDQKRESEAWNRAHAHGLVGRTFFDNGRPRLPIEKILPKGVIFQKK